ncbi:hypothetical protein M3Y97_00562200 [Aphelenchoides bicaudatus]|nr:hypothetical protein M3Y97_00562200 [Aphelenchoides bicaudatus]
MNALKGDDLLYTERMEVVESIKALDSAGRADLVDFLSSKNAAISATMENNACKHFVCTPEELTNVLSVRTINDLLDFWSFVLLQIVPTFSSLTYPLEDDTFQVRPCILTALRDKVLLPILRNRNLSSDDGARIRPILAHVCFATADHSQKHQEFVELSDRILFNINSRLDNEVKIREASSVFEIFNFSIV